MFKKLAANRAARAAAAASAGSAAGSAIGNSPGHEPVAGTGAGDQGTANPVPATRTVPDPLAEPLPDPVTEPLLDPAAPPDYFGAVPHYANSPLAVLGPTGEVLPGTGIRKFVNSLPRVGDLPNNLGNLIPIAVPDTITYPGCDYYEIGVRQYAQQLHEDLPATRLRGYQQLNYGTDDAGRNTIAPPARPYYLGPLIVADRERPVRVKYVNQLPTGIAGELFLPVDTTVPGAGVGPLGGTEHYPQNRTAVHLHGGSTPWISDGGPGQWFTPAGQITSYPRGPATPTCRTWPHRRPARRPRTTRTSRVAACSGTTTTASGSVDSPSTPASSASTCWTTRWNGDWSPTAYSPPRRSRW